MAERIEDLMDAKPAPESIEDLLGEPVGKPTQRVDPGMLRGGVSSIEYGRTTPEMSRRFLTATAGLIAGGLTGTMAFLPSLLIEAGAQGVTDFGLKAAGMKGEEEAPALSARGAISSAAIPATTIVTGGILRGAQLGLGALGGVGREGLEAIGRRGPVESAHFLQDAPKGAEHRIAKEVAEYTRELVRGERKIALMDRAETLIDTIDNIYSQNVVSRPSIGAGETPSLTSQSLGARVIQSGIVRTQPLRAYIHSLRRASLTPEAVSENTALNAFAESLPESMTLRDFTSYIRAMRKPVAEQIGKMTNVSLNPADRIKIAAFASDIRDNILGEGGASLFEASSGKLEAINQFRKLIVDNSGNLKMNAASKWTTILDANKEGVRETFKNFQDQTGLPVYDLAIDLASRRQWDPPDQKVAVFMMSIIARMLRTVARKGAEGISVFANPKITPAITSPFIAPPLVSSHEPTR